MLSGQFHVESVTFPLSETLATVPDARVQFVRVAISPAIVSPHFWSTAEDSEAFDEALRRDSTVETSVRLDTYHGNTLYHVDWTDEAVESVPSYEPETVSVLDAFGTKDGWFLQARFPDRDALTSFRNVLHDAGIRFTTLQLSATERSHPGVAFGLTPKQTEAVVRAFERGYFESPRRTTLDTIAADLGISQQALSDRLRRALDGLVRNTVAAPVHRDVPDLEDEK
jgi:hypothetical protein